MRPRSVERNTRADVAPPVANQALDEPSTVRHVPLAANDWDEGPAFRWTLLAKVLCAIALVALSALHDFVFGPRLAREVREGREQRTRPLLVAIGRAAFAFTIVVPLLGVALTRLTNG